MKTVEENTKTGTSVNRTEQVETESKMRQKEHLPESWCDQNWVQKQCHHGEKETEYTIGHSQVIY